MRVRLTACCHQRLLQFPLGIDRRTAFGRGLAGSGQLAGIFRNPLQFSLFLGRAFGLAKQRGVLFAVLPFARAGPLEPKRLVGQDLVDTIADERLLEIFDLEPVVGADDPSNLVLAQIPDHQR